jgi:hypothetical protein
VTQETSTSHHKTTKAQKSLGARAWRLEELPRTPLSRAAENAEKPDFSLPFSSAAAPLYAMLLPKGREACSGDSAVTKDTSLFTVLTARRPGALRRRTGTAVAGLATLAVVSGLTASPVASLPPSPECPLAYPAADVVKGQAVTGLTVTSGTTPEGFSGEVLGVIRDGIAPGLDMIMARLSSSEIDRVGIWQGMSGSPVYAADGRLVGAVAYGLAWGPSPVAGITPAEEMYRQIDDAPTAPAAVTRATDVDIPPALTHRLVTTGVLDAQEAKDGMTRLPLPVGISGMVNAKRLRQAQRAFAIPGATVHRSGSATSADEKIPVVAGGNLAASLSYGDVSTIGVGTATAVCGDQVLAFGHPMAFTGPSKLTMHGADAVYVQEDPVGPGFKVANAGAPVGAILQDRLSGLMGVQDATAVPGTTDITSYVEVPGEWSRTGTTRISVPDSVPDIAAFHLLADQDRVFDGISGGSATVGWTVFGTRANGNRFVYHRSDRFATEQDLSFDPTFDLYDDLARIHFNELEDVTVDRITSSSTLSRTYRAYKIAKVRMRVGGRWRLLRSDLPLFLRGGTTKRFRVVLTSPALGRRLVRVKVAVPERIGHKSGVLEIVGGNSDYGFGEDFFFDEGGYMGSDANAPKTFGGMMNRLRNEPHNSDVVARLMLFRRNGSTREVTSTRGTNGVVNGGVTVEVMGIGGRHAAR